jgi:hypothetical protein
MYKQHIIYACVRAEVKFYVHMCAEIIRQLVFYMHYLRDAPNLSVLRYNLYLSIRYVFEIIK